MPMMESVKTHDFECNESGTHSMGELSDAAHPSRPGRFFLKIRRWGSSALSGSATESKCSSSILETCLAFFCQPHLPLVRCKQRRVARIRRHAPSIIRAGDFSSFRGGSKRVNDREWAEKGTSREAKFVSRV